MGEGSRTAQRSTRTARQVFTGALLLSALLVLAGPATAAEEPFAVSMAVLPPVVVAAEQSIQFPSAKPGRDTSVVVRPGDIGAAVFSATGVPHERVTAILLDDEVVISTHGGGSGVREIVVTGFVIGGEQAFDRRGTLSGMRLGATATVKPDNVPGVYHGTSTFRIVHH